MPEEERLHPLRDHLRKIIGSLGGLSGLEEDDRGNFSFSGTRLSYRMLFHPPDPGFVRIACIYAFPFPATPSDPKPLDVHLSHINRRLKFAKIVRVPEDDDDGTLVVHIYVDFFAESPDHLTRYALHRYLGMIWSAMVSLARWGAGRKPHSLEP